MAAAPDEGPHVDARAVAERIFLIGLDRLPAGLGFPGANIRQFDLSALTSALLYFLKPDRVVCPLFFDKTDAVQLIEKLAAIGFGGRVTVLANVPKPQIIAAELATICPTIQVEVVKIAAPDSK